MNLNQHRIVVTGGAGFLGRCVQKELLQQGVAREQMFIPRRRDYDLTSPEAVRRMYDDMQPGVVIHLAAEVGGIGANRAQPGRYFYSNLAMGMNLIEEARLRGIEKFVQVGTVCSYPKFTPVPFREEDLWNGYPEETNAPYGIAKKALLVMLQAYRQQHGLNGIYLIPVNLYGPGDNFDLQTSHVIPAMIRKFIEAKRQGSPRVELWGTGAASREFLYVDDAARGIVLALMHYDGAEPVNLGTGKEIEIRALAERIKQIVGYNGAVVWDATRPDGQPRRCLDVTRAKQLFGFESLVFLDEGLQRTIASYSLHRQQE
ncbi:GDP-L-fucose synthase [Phycisphaerae bacterium RAS2]|nr:GDP-L-fucose synthase [Phycisphaerae bacterium RAS2]